MDYCHIEPYRGPGVTPPPPYQQAGEMPAFNPRYVKVPESGKKIAVIKVHHSDTFSRI